MATRSDRSEPPPVRHRRFVWGLDVVEVVLLALAALVVVAAIVLLLSSKEAAGATMLVGVLVAIGSFRTFRITQQGQVTERFTRAIDQLGCDKRDVRLGGIYALERIARDSPDDHAQIVEVLTAYVREHAPWPRKTSDVADSRQATAAPEGTDRAEQEPAGDVQAVIAVLGRRVREHAPWPRNTSDVADSKQATAAPEGADRPEEPAADVQAVIAVLGRRDISREEYRLDLSSTDLEGAKFAKGDRGHFERAFFSKAHLKAARLRETLLNEADFAEADLELADLREAHLEGANLKSAKNLDKAELCGALYDLPSGDGKYCGTRWPEGFDYERAVSEPARTGDGNAACD